MDNLSFKKAVAFGTAIILSLTLSTTAFAHDWPSNIRDWSDSDWKAWEDAVNGYYAEEEEEHERERERAKETEKTKDTEREREYSRDYDRDYEHTVEAVVYEEPATTYTYTYNTATGAITGVTVNNGTAPNSNVITNANVNTNNGIITNSQPAAAANGYYNGIINAYDPNTEAQAEILAKLIHQYCHGIQSQTAQACMGWAVLNSLDASSNGVSFSAVAANFGYNPNEPSVDDYGRDLILLGRDLIYRWKAGKNGVSANGRVLPAGYCWAWSTGSVVVFRNTPNESGAIWNYSLASPYGN